MFDMYLLKSSLVPVHIMKMSSMNLFQVWINSNDRLISFVSNLPMNRLRRQGPFWSPWLFPVFVDRIFRQIRTRFSTRFITSPKISGLGCSGYL